MTFEAYKVAIRLSIVDEFSTPLALLSRGLKTNHGDATKLEGHILSLAKSLRLLSVAGSAGIAGHSMLRGLNLSLKHAEGFNHQLNIMNMAGMKQAEIASSIGAAWDLTGKNLTTTVTGNLKGIIDLRNVLGDLGEAMTALPEVMKMSTILAASKEGRIGSNAHDLAFSAAKALDIRGAVTGGEQRMLKEFDLMTRVVIGTQGRVTPDMFQSVFNFARQAKFQLSDDFAYKYLPTLMLENANKGGGGGSRGIGPSIAALYRFTNQGFINKKAKPLLQDIGMMTKSGGLIGADLAASNPFLWTTQVFAPKIQAHLMRLHKAADDMAVLGVINRATRGNQLAASVMGEYWIKRKNFERDRLLFEGVASPNAAFKMAMNHDPDTARRALKASWENLQTSAMINVVPVIIPAINGLAEGLNELGKISREYPNLTKNLVLGLGGVAGLLAVGSPLLTGLVMFRLAFGGLPVPLLSARVGATSLGSALLPLAAGGSAMSGAIAGVAGLAGGIGGLALAVKGMELTLTAIGTGDKDPLGHPGKKFIRHGRGAGNGEWVIDPDASQLHLGEHFVRTGRGGFWVKDAPPTKDSGSSGNNYRSPFVAQKSTPVQVTVINQLNGKELNREVANAIAKDAVRQVSMTTQYDPTYRRHN